MILYVSERFGGHYGTVESARDLLWAMLAMGYPVTVASTHRLETPAMMAGWPLSVPCWRSASTEPPYPKLHHGRTIPRRFRRYGKYRYREHRARGRGAWASAVAATWETVTPGGPPLAVVNGLGNDRYWQTVRTRPPKQTMLVVRESPRHFSGRYSQTDLDSAVRTLAQYDVLTFVSSRCGEAWLERPELSGKRNYYLPNCCDEDAAEALRTESREVVGRALGFDSGAFNVVCVASIQYRKGQDLILNQLEGLRARIPNLRVYLAGPAVEWGGGEEILERIGEHPLREAVVVVGATDEALRYAYAADAVLLPTRAEAMPRTILEAMALGTPIVATDVDGIPELIDHGEHGLLFSPEEPEQMVEHLGAVAQDPEGASGRAQQAYDRYWQAFSRRRQFERMSGIVGACLGRPGYAVRG